VEPNGQNGPSYNEQSSGKFLSDLTDGRNPGDWKTRYVDSEAQKMIQWERNYLLVLFFLSFILGFLDWLLFVFNCFGIDSNKFINFNIYVFAAIGGLLGGTIYSMKWLVHGIAKTTWNADRRLWRIFTPLFSSAIALLFVILYNTNFLTGTDTQVISLCKAFGIGSLAGYFSDNAIGKLAEIAQVLFGATNVKSK
jgi:hypothetical protein